MQERSHRRRLARIPLRGLLGAGLMLAAAPADAEIVFFRTGRTMSVAGHRPEGRAVVLELRGGGEIVCDGALIERITPDEVPYPAPAAAFDGAGADPSVPYDDLIRRSAERYGVDAALVRAVIQVESAYRPEARSSKGAMGLMQLMPGTARQYAVRDPYDPGANVDAGVRHLRSLLDRFDLSLALAAYNAGEGAVRKFGGIPPFPETRAYVSRVLQQLGAR